MELGNIIRQKRQSKRLTLDQVALMCGMSKPYLSRIENGKTSNPPSDPMLEALESALGFTKGYLTNIARFDKTPTQIRNQFLIMQMELTKAQELAQDVVAQPSANNQSIRKLELWLKHQKKSPNLPIETQIPIINQATNDFPRRFVDIDQLRRQSTSFISLPGISAPQAFAVQIPDDSMSPAYHAGDLVIFSPAVNGKNTEDCFVVLTNGSTSFRKVFRDDENTLRLQPLNNSHKPQIFPVRLVRSYWPVIGHISFRHG